MVDGHFVQNPSAFEARTLLDIIILYKLSSLEQGPDDIERKGHLTAMHPRIHDFMIDRFPEIAFVFKRVGVVELISPDSTPLPEAIVKVVIGQILSRHAADVIYERLRNVAAIRGHDGSWELSSEELRECGGSARK